MWVFVRKSRSRTSPAVKDKELYFLQAHQKNLLVIKATTYAIWISTFRQQQLDFKLCVLATFSVYLQRWQILFIVQIFHP